MIFLGIILGTIIFLLIIFIIICIKFKKIIRNLGYVNFNELKNHIETGEIAYKYNHKNVTGMTKFLLPKIVKDFPNFSESELYNKVELSLLSIFKSLEEKEVNNIEELNLIKGKLIEVINDLKQTKTDLVYDSVKFHRHAIKYYKRTPGVLNITVSTSLEYFYEEKVNSKIVVKKEDYKRQTSYTTEFIYIYDTSKYGFNQNLVGVSCPNCGAPVKKLGIKNCSYCGSFLEDINLKHWYISSYKEDYE